MAILKQRQKALGPLEQLVSDLPQLLIGLYAMNEQMQLQQEKMQNAEEMKLLELSLQNLAMYSDRYTTQIANYRNQIDKIEEEFQNTTSYLPNTDDLHGSSDNTAMQVLDQLEDSLSGPIYDVIKDRSQMIIDDSETASTLKVRLDRLEEDQDTLRFLKANMSQNLLNIASQGGDPYMVDAADFQPYWEETLLPALKESGRIPKTEGGEYDQGLIDRYNKIWSGMLAPSTTRMAQKKTILENRELTIKQGMEEQNIVDIGWDQLDQKSKDEVLKRQELKLGAVVGPQVNIMSVGIPGAVNKLRANLELIGSDDNKYLANNDPSNYKNWKDETQAAYMSVQDQYARIGALLTGTVTGVIDTTALGEVRASVENSFDRSTGAFTDAMLAQQIKIGRNFIQSYSAISKEKGATEHLFMQQLELAQQYLTVQTYTNTGKPVKKDGKPVLIDYSDDPDGKKRRRKRDILKLIGLSADDYDNGVLDAIIKQYKWVQDKKKSGLGALLDNTFPKDTTPTNLSSQIKTEELYAFKPSAGEERFLDQSVIEAIASAENEWII